jgi:hypothetical protein
MAVQDDPEKIKGFAKRSRHPAFVVVASDRRTDH